MGVHRSIWARIGQEAWGRADSFLHGMRAAGIIRMAEEFAQWSGDRVAKAIAGKSVIFMDTLYASSQLLNIRGHE
jgi:hypothetical protein